MKFLADAQWPRRPSVWLQERGHEVIHSLDLAEQNRTPDSFLLTLANQDARVLITKDTDFEITHDNIHNDELLTLFARHEETVFRLLDQHTFLELSRSQLIVHK